LPSFQFACSGVTPASATSAHTNQLLLVCVSFNCCSKTLFSVGAGFSSLFCARVTMDTIATAATTITITISVTRFIISRPPPLS
jgi:hypothetical protein